MKCEQSQVHHPAQAPHFAGKGHVSETERCSSSPEEIKDHDPAQNRRRRRCRNRHRNVTRGHRAQTRRGPGPRRLRARFLPDLHPQKTEPAVSTALHQGGLDWAGYWRVVDAELQKGGYSRGTRLGYRQVWRSYARFARERMYGPDFEKVPQSRFVVRDPEQVEAFLVGLSRKGVSARWSSMSLNVLRSIFDKIGGHQVTTGLSGPRLPKTLPEVLTRSEAKRLFEAFETLRDHLLFGLAYCCGLKVGELCRLTWGDIDVEAGTVRVGYGRGTRSRRLALGKEMLAVLREGKASCVGQGLGQGHGFIRGEGEYVFAGRRAGKHLSPRAIQLALKRAARRAGIFKPVSCMTLRHSYAVNQLNAGGNIRQVQESLGHLKVVSTLKYDSLRGDLGVVSPLDRLEVEGPLSKACRTFSERLALPFAGGRSSGAFQRAFQGRWCRKGIGLGAYGNSARAVNFKGMQEVLRI